MVFLAWENDRPVGPIDGFCGEGGDVGLTTTQMPKKLVKGQFLWVLLSVNNPKVLFLGDRLLGGVSDLGPLTAGNDWGGDPAHIEGEVVEPSQEDVGGDSAVVKGLKEETGLAWAVLEDVELEDLLEGSVLLGGFQSVAGGTGCAALDVGVDDVLPSSGLGVRVCFPEVSDGDSVGEIGFFHRCFVAAEHFLCGSAVFGTEADSVSVDVLGVEVPRGLALEEVQGTGSEGF